MAPLERPVVPEVYKIAPKSSGPRGIASKWSDWSLAALTRLPVSSALRVSRVAPAASAIGITASLAVSSTITIEALALEMK